MAFPPSRTPPSRYSESDGATVVADNNPYLRPAPVASGSKQPSFHKDHSPPKPLPVPLVDTDELPFVDEKAYLDVKR
jgi:hypothetical protein